MANGNLQGAVVTALDNAKALYGINGQTPYNYNLLDKQRNDALYCSQLAWKIYGAAGLDIDSQNALYSSYMFSRFGIAGPAMALAAIAPDEIAPDADLVRVALVVIP